MAFIPILGPAIVWVPLVLIKLALGDYTTAIGVIVIGVIISVGVDYLLRIKIMRDKTEINPIIMLIGILGGIKLFGLIGVIIGPLILSVLVTLTRSIPTHTD